ncbi:MAG: YqgE/AlgH family protein [Gammaproteobacteria bacterium]|nr:YqgE/AlgH family protein [Gammaproteobacteria bacterium]MBL7000036.1 YqgE/AlgH family protein [Gammaproteobacteria bacterium]
MSENNLIHQYLLATPSIKDPLFAASLIYLCEHSAEGCMGMVVNQPSDQTLESIFTQLNINCTIESIRQLPIFIGGPVNLQQGFVLHTAPCDWEKSLAIRENICLTSSRDILEAIARDQGPAQFLVLLGYSGWSAGQLEQELQSNAWLTTASTSEITFHQQIQSKWQMAFDTLGFNLDKLSPTTGNA